MARTGPNHINQIAPAPWPAAWESEPFAIPGTLQECIDQLKEAKRDVKQIIKESFAQRDSARRERIRDLEESSSPTDKKSAMILRRLRKAEDIKELFRKLKPLCHPNKRKGVTRIEIPLHPEADPKSCTE